MYDKFSSEASSVSGSSGTVNNKADSVWSNPKRLATGLVVLGLVAASCGTDEDSYGTTEDAAESNYGNDAGDYDDAAQEIAAPQVDNSGADAGLAPQSAEAVTQKAGFGEEAGLTQTTDGESAPEEPTPDFDPVETSAVVRTVIRRATIQLQVDDVVNASKEAAIVVESMGGFVFGQATSTEGEPRSSITFKIAPEDFQRAIAELSDLGFLRDQTITADDVTGRVVDLQSQIATSETSVERLRLFLSEAKDLATITSLENSLLERESQLESLRGQLRTIQSQAALSTITVVFSERIPGPDLEFDVTVYPGHDNGGTCLGNDELDATEDDELTVCYRVTNTGDTYLTSFVFRDSGLKLDQDDFVEAQEGELDEPLAPGDSLTMYVEIEADPDRSTVLGQVSADPSDELGNSLDLEGVSGRDDLRMSVEKDNSLPSFVDGLKDSLGALAYLASLLVLIAGFALPFIWLLPLAYLARRWFLARPKKAKPVKTGASANGPVAQPAAPGSDTQPPAPAAETLPAERGPESQ